MPSFNFKPQFANKVKRNTKPGTVRQVRKKPMKVGDTMHCFTGMRTRDCKKIVSRPCVAIVDIHINSGWAGHCVIKLNGKQDDFITGSFAKDDGFKSSEEFLQFFRTTYSLPFTGHWYLWKKSALKKYAITQ
jgi:hypothetical protein